MPKLSDEQLAEIRENNAPTNWQYSAPFAAHDDIVDLLAHIDAQQERIDALEAEVADLQSAAVGTQAVDCVPERAEGHRYYVAAYRARNGNIIPFGHEVLDPDYAKREVMKLSSDDDDETPMFVATRVVPPWLPVQENSQ